MLAEEWASVVPEVLESFEGLLEGFLVELECLAEQLSSLGLAWGCWMLVGAEVLVESFQDLMALLAFAQISD